MKKKLLIALALLASLTLAAQSFAATTATVNITVTIVSGVVSIANTGPADVSFNATNPTILFNQTGYVSADGTGNGRAIFKNDSVDTTADFSVQAIDFDPNFTLGTAPSATAGVLYGIWTQWDRTPIAASDFVANDIITTTSKLSSTTDFALDGEGDNVKGFNIPAGDERNMYFRLDTPTSGTAGSFTSTMTVTASVHI